MIILPKSYSIAAYQTLLITPFVFFLKKLV